MENEKTADKAEEKTGASKKGATKSAKKNAAKKVASAVAKDAKKGSKRRPPRKMSPRQNNQGYLAQATLRHVRVSPRKLRLALNLVRGKQVDQALQILQFNPRKGCAIVSKLLRSAIANAREREGADVDRLWVSGGSVEQGPTMMRYMPAAQGRATPVRKRSAHLTVRLDQR